MYFFCFYFLLLKWREQEAGFCQPQAGKMKQCFWLKLTLSLVFKNWSTSKDKVQDTNLVSVEKKLQYEG